ncbi:MAG TPA: SRPBCC family protein [Burkholderiaceae bacterium]|nr:SRPBCC family protein [Burkholderiaceae bacterium]
MQRRQFIALLCATLFPATVPAALASVDMQISVARRGEVFLVDAVFVAPVSQREAWSVLTDFDGMSRFVPNLDESRIADRDGERLRVEQRGIARWGPLTHAFTMVRDIQLEPIQQVRSNSVGGTMRQVQSLTQLAAVSGGTEVRHHIEFAVDTWMPDLLIEPFLRHEVREQFEAVVAEMLRRRASGGAH